MRICELELEWLDLNINAEKSTCLLIGPRFNVKCSNITTKAGHEVIWHSEIRYLGVYLTAAREYRCSHSNAKQSFYTPCPKKRGHVIFNYNSRIPWSISIIFIPLETGMNTPQLHVI